MYQVRNSNTDTKEKISKNYFERKQITEKRRGEKQTKINENKREYLAAVSKVILLSNSFAIYEGEIALDKK